MNLRIHRTAPARNFNGGYAEHGSLLPMSQEDARFWELRRDRKGMKHG